MNFRAGGILLHISSLPSLYGIGDLGPAAYKFVDFLASSGMHYWQVLPLTPTEPAYGNSPYQSPSAFAFNPLLISPERLHEEGLLSKKDLKGRPRFPRAYVHYAKVVEYKQGLLGRAFERFKADGVDQDFETFCGQNKHWLESYCLFMALRAHFPEKHWHEWPSEVKDRSPQGLEKAKKAFSEIIHQMKFQQYMFWKQWHALKTYCNKKDIRIIGDMPIYVQFNSADLWAFPHYFRLDPQKRPEVVAGVPPDYFSATGQLWGNPIYHWDRLRENRYDWWIERIGHNLDLFDFLRVDHFRGLVAYWEVPAEEKVALNGKWVPAPANDFFRTVLKKFPFAPFIAEDLGFITPDVREIIREFQLPGMRVLLFAFEGDLGTNIHALHNHERNCVVYTGTHDNNTAMGWFQTEADARTRDNLYAYMGRRVRRKDVPWLLIRLAMMSTADTIVIPLQDILCLGGAARMNRPAGNTGNWEWRLKPGKLTEKKSTKLLTMNQVYGRA